MKRHLLLASAFILLVAALPSAALADAAACGSASTLRSPGGAPTAATSILFVNKSAAPINIVWIDYDGARKPYATIAPGKNLVQRTFVNHLWTIESAAGRCLGVFSGISIQRSITVTDTGLEER